MNTENGNEYTVSATSIRNNRKFRSNESFTAFSSISCKVFFIYLTERFLVAFRKSP